MSRIRGRIQQRRALMLAWLAAGSLLVLAAAATGAGVFAYRAQQKAVQGEQQAIAERDKATRNFKLARQTADSLVFDVARGLRQAEGMRAESVRKILETAKATFERFTASAPDDLELQRSRAVMLDEFGSTYLTLGDLTEALQAYRDGLAIREHLAKADPNHAGGQRDLSVSYVKVGYVLKAQGNLPQALQAYRDSLGVAERLAKADPGDTGWQFDLGISHERIGDALKEQGDLAAALREYEAKQTIIERLAKADPGNTEWERDLSVSYNKVGDALRAQGDLPAALLAYRDSIAIMERLAKVDPGITIWQHDLSLSYEIVGDVLEAQGSLPEALQAYRDSLAIMERVAKTDPGNTQWQDDLQIRVGRLGGVAYSFVLSHDFATALEIADQVIALAPDLIFVHANRAHALMFLGRADEARTLYFRYRGRIMVVDEKPWEASVLDDFAELRRAGLSHPLMDEIEKTLSAQE